MNKKTLPKNILMISAATLLSSCASTESYQSKMNRYSPKNLSKNQVPEITVKEFNFKEVKKSRMPASVAHDNAQKTNELSTTNKKLYFLALQNQYEKMKQFAYEYEAPSINSCPNFHSSFLTITQNTSQKNNYKFNYDISKLSDDNYISYHPELLLPLSKEDKTPKVIDVVKNAKKMHPAEINDYIKKAFDIHLAKTYNELKELCEYGVSDNYYIYENLITHIKSNEFHATPSNMNTLLKTTVFSNHALLVSLNKYSVKVGRSIASTNDSVDEYSNQIMSRLNTNWAKEYFNSIRNY